jgi:hypothetical protein
MPGSEITALLDFLLRICPDAIKIVWDLENFASPILKMLNLDICRQIAGPTHEATFSDGSDVDYSIFYLEGILFSIRKKQGGISRRKVTFYGLNGFFDDDVSEPTCVFQLKEMACKLLGELEKIGISPKKLTSPIGSFLSACRLPSLPTILDTPDQFMEAQLYAEQCDGREWREALSIGHWSDDECYSYDISCAYGSEAARLPDLRYAQYIHSKEMIDSAYFGFLRGTVTINDNVRCSPIMARLDGRLVNPTGTWNTFLTLDEVRFIQRWEIGNFRMIDGWFLRFKHTEFPLRELIENLYLQRSRSDRILNTFLKRVPSGIVGKFHEHRDDGLGDLFNPIYHAVITSNIRLKVANLIYENNAQNNILRINTDGLITDKPLWIARRPGIGKWRQVESQASIILSPELVFQGGKHPNGLTYPRLRSLICRHPKSALYADRRIKKRVSLFEAIRDHELAKLGEMTTRSGRIDLTLLAQSQIRNFPKFPRTGEQLIENKYDSTPIRLGNNSRNSTLVKL